MSSSLALPPLKPLNGMTINTPSPTAGPSITKRKSPTPPPPAEEEEDEENESEDEKKKGSGSGAGGKKKKDQKEKGSEYKYTSEISQMMFVFGEVQDPLPETVRLVEDIVRGQIIEIVTRARLLTHLRSSRFLSAEDLIFLIRDDRGKVNRLRTYLSWKDVRKRAKEDEERGGDVELEVEGADDKAAAKGRKTMMKLPWELLTPFSDYLRTLPSKQNRDDDEEEDEDEIQAHQDSMQRLRDADEITKKMTKDEYVHYSDCRQASFTYRKARRFREFVNFSAYLDVKPNDDIIDILGFLSFEMVRSLCVTALELRESLELTKPQSERNTSPVKRKSTNETSPNNSKKLKLDDGNENKKSTSNQPISLFAPPPSARQPLLPGHILEAFAQIQRTEAASRVGGMRNFKSGLGKGRLALV
ncbi:transcription initiation protein SPT3 [Kwoniella mangroviensis CBS 10435]|uniref:Transcription initiation protein SPT3 n=1 Tax=Kwoniella mangroviensis CBS 10435 TaxID=1331196 RepID=A0A1B9IWH3_9TREE|nr:transcription initiation protein SPT3 [Kwoniella mangroviensis CBS 8507]OCF59873.1 transcription initiation protein SPT3 [Kwoniella mangroviensis CBS 10435]OCF69751.1 transcription initiation protein SPT3 [Kwoniella mangroviensis CBS 8507]OCF71396.1 transcription initiation protein SPT3 [Kwoniella mangroviensis CBS 8886]